MKILYTDNSNLFIYMCPREDVNGFCAPARISIILYSRDKQTSKNKMEHLIRTLDNECMPWEKFQEISHNGTYLYYSLTGSVFCSRFHGLYKLLCFSLFNIIY